MKIGTNTISLFVFVSVQSWKQNLFTIFQEKEFDDTDNSLHRQWKNWQSSSDMNHPPSPGINKKLEETREGHIITAHKLESSDSYETLGRAALAAVELWRKGSWTLPERRYCWRQSKRGINILPSPLLPHSSASHWMNPTGRQLTKDLGSYNSLRCRAEVGRDGKWIWEVAEVGRDGKWIWEVAGNGYERFHIALGTLEISIFERPYLCFFLKSRRKILVWAMFFFFNQVPCREHGKYMSAFACLFP